MKKSRFVVYKLFFESSDKIYVGKTFDIKKRITDHIYTATVLGERTHKGAWIRKHIKTSEIKHEILFETEDEQSAYDKELEFIKMFTENGVRLVNTMRLVQAGGNKGVRPLSEAVKKKMSRLFGIPHVLINKKGEIYHTESLKAFGEANGLDYKGLHSSASGRIFMSQGYKVFKKHDWDALDSEAREEIIDKVKKYNPYRTPPTIACKKDQRREFWLLNLDGSIEHGIGAEQYFIKMGYNSGNLFYTQKIKRPREGKILFYSLTEMEDFKRYKLHNFVQKIPKDVRDNYIFQAVNKTEKFSRSRSEVIKNLSDVYGLSYRRVSEIYNKLKEKNTSNK